MYINNYVWGETFERWRCFDFPNQMTGKTYLFNQSFVKSNCKRYAKHSLCYWLKRLKMPWVINSKFIHFEWCDTCNSKVYSAEVIPQTLIKAYFLNILVEIWLKIKLSSCSVESIKFDSNWSIYRLVFSTDWYFVQVGSFTDCYEAKLSTTIPWSAVVRPTDKNANGLHSGHLGSNGPNLKLKFLEFFCTVFANYVISRYMILFVWNCI